MMCTVCGMDACGLASHKQLAKAIAESAEEYEVTLSKSDPIDQAMQQVRLAKAQEAREDLEIIAKMVRQYRPELSEAQVVSEALHAYPQLYDDMVGG